MVTLFCIRPKGFNVGNDAIFLGMQHFIYNAFGEVVNLISLPATSRYESEAKAGLTPKTIYEINQYGHGVIIGGGNLYENGELDVSLDALEALECPMMLFSLSRGRIYNRLHQMVDRTDAMPGRVIRALNDKASYSLARDNATEAYLKSIGCKNSKVGGCPTLFLDRVAERLPEIPEQYTGSALISIRNPLLMSIPLKKQIQVHSDITKIIIFLREEGFRDVRLLCHDYRDISFAASFADIDYVYTGDVYSYLSLLRSCALNISYRLHSVLPCLAFGSSAINISYDERASSLLETVGFGEWNIDMILSDDVIAEVINRYQQIKNIQTLRTQAKTKWEQLYKTMSETFGEFASEVFLCRDQQR
jgi:polysaccharide pyruvyl transferase WcaK-like protein